MTTITFTGETFAAMVVALLLAAHASAQAVSQNEVCKKYSDAVVSIKAVRGVGSSMGTGFLVASDGWILTAKHVVVDMESNAAASVITITVPGRPPLDARLVPNPDKHSAAEDFAIVKVESEHLPFLRIGDESAAENGDSVAFIGFPFSAIGAGNTQFCLSGLVAAHTLVQTPGGNLDVIYFQGPSVKGVSGSPIISLKTGQVVGIVDLKLTGISNDLQTARNNMESFGEAMTITGAQGQKVGVTSTMSSIIDTLDTQLANGLGAALGVNDAKYAIQKAERQSPTKSAAR